MSTAIALVTHPGIASALRTQAEARCADLLAAESNHSVQEKAG